MCTHTFPPRASRSRCSKPTICFRERAPTKGATHSCFDNFCLTSSWARYNGTRPHLVNCHNPYIKAERSGDISSVISHIMKVCSDQERDINEKMMCHWRFCHATKI